MLLHILCSLCYSLLTRATFVTIHHHDFIFVFFFLLDFIGQLHFPVTDLVKYHNRTSLSLSSPTSSNSTTAAISPVSPLSPDTSLTSPISKYRLHSGQSYIDWFRLHDKKNELLFHGYIRVAFYLDKFRPSFGKSIYYMPQATSYICYVTFAHFSIFISAYYRVLFCCFVWLFIVFR